MLIMHGLIKSDSLTLKTPTLVVKLRKYRQSKKSFKVFPKLLKSWVCSFSSWWCVEQNTQKESRFSQENAANLIKQIYQIKMRGYQKCYLCIFL